MIKFRLYYDKDAEELFLNNMVGKGYAMKKYNLGFYTFEKCEPNEYTYRVDMLTEENYEHQSEYIKLIKESGADLVQERDRYAIFRKKGSFELYSDKESKIELYSRIKRRFISLVFYEVLGLLFYYMFFSNIVGIVDIMLLTIIFISIIRLVSLVFKCNKKINVLKEEI